MWILINKSNEYQPILFKADSKKEVEKFYEKTKSLYNDNAIQVEIKEVR